MKPSKHNLALLFLLISLNSFSQCPAPSNVEWEYVNDSTYFLTFESQVSGQYTLEMSNYVEEFDGVVFTEGNAVQGINSITVEISSIPNSDPPWATFPLNEPYHLTCALRTICDGQNYSEPLHFYMSNQSLINNQGLDCHYSTFPYNENGYSDEILINNSINVPFTDERIGSVSVTIDLSSNAFNMDVPYILELTHPSGISILLDTLSVQGAKSIIYTDDGFAEELAPHEYSGILQPLEPLSALTGLVSHGEWHISLTLAELGLIVPIDLLGVCLNIEFEQCDSSISGSVFYDLDANNSQEPDEPRFSFPLIQASGSSSFYGDWQGEFWNCPEVGQITLYVSNTMTYYQSPALSVLLQEGEMMEEITIPITPTEIVSDVSVDLTSLEPNRPGFTTTYQLAISNVGTICDNYVSVNLTFPEYVEIIDSENTELSFSGNEANLEIIELCPFAPFEVNLTILLDDTVSLGTMLDGTISANVSDDDPNELNNTFTSSVEVVGSYDPNDKQVSATTIGDEFLSNESPLKYTIRFQNTGTFYAERVVIADTIDTDLDINSLHIISTSHNMHVVREGNVLYFEFDQIFLPDSTTDFEGSIGHVRYQIDPLPSFSAGEIIENTAYIYFDFNEPIVTNTVVTEFGNQLGSSFGVDFDLAVYPNPAQNTLMVSWSQSLKPNLLQIFDLSGRLVEELVIKGNSNLQLVDVSSFEKGAYLLKLRDPEYAKTLKFVKY